MPEHSSPRFQVCRERRLSPRRAARVVASSVFLLVAAAAACTGPARETPAARESAHVAAGSRELKAESPPVPSPLADSAAAADARFQAARAAVNRDAQALDARSAQRHTQDYATAYDELRRRTLAAESLRADRDALRKRLHRADAGASQRR